MIYQPWVKRLIYDYVDTQQNWLNSSDVQDFIKIKLRI